MAAQGRRLLFASGLLGLGFLLFCLSPGLGQLSFNEREVRSTPVQGDKGEIWTLDFRFKDPRIIKVNVPGQGTRIYWYLWYQVINRTEQPVKFFPKFEIVTLDFPATFMDGNYDETVEKAIIQYEDPTGYQDIKNSVTISSKPIPVSRPDAFPKAVTGIAVWEAAVPTNRDGKANDLMETSRFNIFAQGLSNGFVQVDPLAEGMDPIIRRKTLQLSFRRNGAKNSLDSRNLVFEGPPQWLYRAGNTKIAP